MFLKHFIFPIYFQLALGLLFSYCWTSPQLCDKVVLSELLIVYENEQRNSGEYLELKSFCSQDQTDLSNWILVGIRGIDPEEKAKGQIEWVRKQQILQLG